MPEGPIAGLTGVTSGGLAPDRGLGGTTPAAACKGRGGAEDWDWGTGEGLVVAVDTLYSSLGPAIVLGAGNLAFPCAMVLGRGGLGPNTCGCLGIREGWGSGMLLGWGIIMNDLTESGNGGGLGMLM